MPTAYSIISFHTMNFEKFADDVNVATAGRLKIKVHSAGSLLKHPEIKTPVRSGHVQIGKFLLSQLANESPLFHVDLFPFWQPIMRMPPFFGPSRNRVFKGFLARKG